MKEITEGLAYVHKRLDDNSYRRINNAALLTALVEILTKEGLIERDALKDRR